jgi:hypothetical protein
MAAAVEFFHVELATIDAVCDHRERLDLRLFQTFVVPLLLLLLLLLRFWRWQLLLHPQSAYDPTTRQCVEHRDHHESEEDHGEHDHDVGVEGA